MMYRECRVATISRGLLLSGLLFGSFVTAQTNSDSIAVDEDTGLKQAPGWQVVRRTCTQCHTAQIITSNSGNRAVWESRIRWMQNSQGLGKLSPDTEDQILGYLATHYGQKDSTRRQPLPAKLMPANPFAPDLK